MKYILPASLSFIFLCSCTAMPVKEQWAEKLRGEMGYFYVPVYATYDPVAVVPPQERCQPVTITQVKKFGDLIEIEASQEGVPRLYKYHSYGQPIVEAPAGHVAILESFFKRELPKDRTISAANAAPFQSRKGICDGKLWIGMTEEEMVFVKGLPEKINLTRTSSIESKQYVYRIHPNATTAQYFYITNGKLSAIQR